MLWRIPRTAEQSGTVRAQAEQGRQRIRPRRASRAPQRAPGGDADSAIRRCTSHYLSEHHARQERLDTGAECHPSASVARNPRRHQAAPREDAAAATHAAQGCSLESLGL